MEINVEADDVIRELATKYANEARENAILRAQNNALAKRLAELDPTQEGNPDT